jgi:hypothetical protein
MSALHPTSLGSVIFFRLYPWALCVTHVSVWTSTSGSLEWRRTATYSTNASRHPAQAQWPRKPQCKQHTLLPAQLFCYSWSDAAHLLQHPPVAHRRIPVALLSCVCPAVPPHSVSLP